MPTANLTAEFFLFIIVAINKYRCATVSMNNTFQDLLRLRETTDNTERYIYHDIHVTNLNTVKLDK
jgi:hypothetical protein